MLRELPRGRARPARAGAAERRRRRRRRRRHAEEAGARARPAREGRVPPARLAGRLAGGGARFRPIREATLAVGAAATWCDEHAALQSAQGTSLTKAKACAGFSVELGADGAADPQTKERPVRRERSNARARNASAAIGGCRCGRSPRRRAAAATPLTLAFRRRRRRR